MPNPNYALIFDPQERHFKPTGIEIWWGVDSKKGKSGPDGKGREAPYFTICSKQVVNVIWHEATLPKCKQFKRLEPENA